jgi:hypothetical protein
MAERCYAQCWYVDCHYAECQYAECRGTKFSQHEEKKFYNIESLKSTVIILYSSLIVDLNKLERLSVNSLMPLQNAHSNLFRFNRL